MNVYLWESPSGKRPVGDFILGLSVKAQEKIKWVLDLFEEQGLRLIYTKHLEKLKGYDLYELRIEFNKVFYRIFLIIIETSSWLLHMFIKKSNHTPQKEIDIALKRSQTVLNYLN